MSSRVEIVEGGGMIPLVTGPVKMPLRRGRGSVGPTDAVGGSSARASRLSLPREQALDTTTVFSKGRTVARLSLLLIFGLIASAFSGVRAVGAHMVRSTVDGVSAFFKVAHAPERCTSSNVCIATRSCMHCMQKLAWRAPL